MRWVRIVGVNLLVVIALLELGLFLSATMGLIRIDLPSYSIANLTPFWRDTNVDFGVWHPANSQYRHLKPCFDIVYRTNSHGMRDAERNLRSDGPRVVVLGDSFVEGYGVDQPDRLSNSLEARSGTPHLNFGTSGNFGLTQSWMLYKTLAKNFDHDAVILSILPANDFTDDDFSKAETVYRHRYRPYLVGAYPDYDLRYSNPDSLSVAVRDYQKYIKLALNEFSYTVKAHSYFDNYLKIMQDAEKHARLGGSEKTGSRYFAFTQAEFDRMRYAVEQIVALAAPRPVLVVSVAYRTDYERARREAGAAPLSRQLAALAAKAGFTYVDLLERLGGRGDLDDLFHSCDAHWNAKGNAAASGELAGWAYYSGRANRPAGGKAEDVPVGSLPSPPGN